MKKGYLLAIVDVADEERYKQYIARTPGVIDQFGGRFVSRGSVFKVLEGGLSGKRIVVVEFDSPETVDRFYQSEAYLAIKHFRTDAANSTELLILSGV